MIEVTLVGSMLRLGLILGPLAVAAFAAFGGAGWALSAAIGVGFALANLWLAGRILGGLAENKPELLAAGALAAFVIGLGALLAGGTYLKNVETVDMTVAGLSLIGTHVVLVTWAAADTFLKLPPKNETTVSDPAGLRS